LHHVRREAIEKPVGNPDLPRITAASLPDHAGITIGRFARSRTENLSTP
jgi:hypothetical protein